MILHEYRPKRPFKLPDGIPSNLEGWIAGGSVLSHVQNTEPADFDFYPKSKKDALEMMYYLLEDCGGFVLDVSERAMTIKTNTMISSYDRAERSESATRAVYQIIFFKEWNSIEDVFNTFDFSACMIAFNVSSKKIECTDGFMRAIASKEIEFHTGTAFPIASLTRINKYQKKGFRFSKATMLKMGLTVAQTIPPSSWQEMNAMLGGYYGKKVTMSVPDSMPFSIENAMHLLETVDFSVTDGTTSEWPKFTDTFIPFYRAAVQGNIIKKLNIAEKSLYLIPEDEEIAAGVLTFSKAVLDISLEEMYNVVDMTAIDALSQIQDITVVFHGFDAASLPAWMHPGIARDVQFTYMDQARHAPKIFPMKGPDDLYVKLDRKSSLIFLLNDIGATTQHFDEIGLKRDDNLVGEMMVAKDAKESKFTQPVNLWWQPVYETIRV